MPADSVPNDQARTTGCFPQFVDPHACPDSTAHKERQNHSCPSRGSPIAGCPQLCIVRTDRHRRLAYAVRLSVRFQEAGGYAAGRPPPPLPAARQGGQMIVTEILVAVPRFRHSARCHTLSVPWNVLHRCDPRRRQTPGGDVGPSSRLDGSGGAQTDLPRGIECNRAALPCAVNAFQDPALIPRL
jgi:hypothetical protein